MTMGTAGTMTAIAEALGMTLPGASSIPAANANHIRMSAECGRRIVDMVWEDLTPTRIQTNDAFLNAITVAMAMGCSTNAIIHLIAMARRAGQTIGLDDFERASRTVPVIANIRPSGDNYLMEDFFYAGGLPGLMSKLRDHLHLDASTHRDGTHARRKHRRGRDLQRRRHTHRREPVYTEGRWPYLRATSPRRLRHQA